MIISSPLQGHPSTPYTYEHSNSIMDNEKEITIISSNPESTTIQIIELPLPEIMDLIDQVNSRVSQTSVPMPDVILVHATTIPTINVDEDDMDGALAASTNL